MAIGQANLGLMYWNGVAMRANPREAMVWFRRAANQDLAWAQILMGDAYARGRGVVRDDREAIKWYRKAALQGYLDAQIALGEIHSRGHGVTRDDVEALRWFALAARQGSEEARRSLENIAGFLRRVKLPVGVTVREEPNLASRIIRNVVAGEYGYLMQREDDWMQIYLVDGYTVGFVSAAEFEVN